MLFITLLVTRGRNGSTLGYLNWVTRDTFHKPVVNPGGMTQAQARVQGGGARGPGPHLEIEKQKK